MQQPETLEQRREQRLRSAARRQGYLVRKSRARTANLHDLGGYRIVDPYFNTIVAGETFDLDLDDVESWLSG